MPTKAPVGSQGTGRPEWGTLPRWQASVVEPLSPSEPARPENWGQLLLCLARRVTGLVPAAAREAPFMLELRSLPMILIASFTIVGFAFQAKGAAPTLLQAAGFKTGIK